MKTGVLEAIGETGLRRPAQVNAALMANDQIKYLLSLLQMAIARADNPEQPAESLQRERLAVGLNDATLDRVVAAAQKDGARYRLPGAARILARLKDGVRAMAVPLTADGAGRDLASRLDTLLAGLPEASEDVVDGGAILDMTRAGHPGADSLHQLVMDMHKALNALQAELAEERLDGASVYGLRAEDRPLVAAFMAGVNRTAPLKFDHPGLATTATRSGSRLIIQNDIGTTDAHVIVIHVQDLVVEVSYSDVHAERARFLRDMLSKYPVAWGSPQARRDAALASGEAFVLSRGRLQAADEAGLLAYLDHLGSRLVFLIDWNRARKQVRNFLRGPQCLALLSWAAENDLGHRAFLELGGARLINRAIEAAASSAIHFGDRLCDVLGDDITQEFLRFVLRAASEGLRGRQSAGLIQDRIRTDLAAHFSDEARRPLRVAADHAGLIFELASLARDGVHAAATDPAADAALVRRARAFEHDADQIVASLRDITRRRADHEPLLQLAEAADDAADYLEEAASLLELLGRSRPAGPPLDALGRLADLLVEAAQEWVKILAHAAVIGNANGAPSGSQDDVDDFLTAVDRVATLEHAVDDAERALTYAAVQQAADFRQLHLYAEMGRALEVAADALKRASLIARDRVFGQVLNG